ncbi:MAG: adenosylhomocysteinase [Oscillospiraceae bacterium]|jgi:adenosylhomocysteinase|nr:adenosylhomocysteinase [Oscillospiraceae bacterium]
MRNIKDISLAPSGAQKIAWVRRNMPLLNKLEADFGAEKPFKGLRVALSVHLEAKTAYLCQVLAAGGAEMWVTGSNPLSTQDDVAAALAQSDMRVFAMHGCDDDTYNAHIRAVLAPGPHIIIDDGGDLVESLRKNFPQHIPNVIGGCEETTTGILRLTALHQKGELPFPMIRVNDADCKHLFDNRYGTGQSVFDGINRTTNLIVAGKTVVVAGYGWCGKGVAMRAKGLGAQVIVTEIDPVKGIEAIMDGFAVLPMAAAAGKGDYFITVTGCCGVITMDHMMRMRDGAILANAGHFNVEIDVAALAETAVKITEMRQNITGYELPNGRTICLLAEGRLVNLAAGDGHPAEIMDMSFAIQALSARWLAEHPDEAKAQMLLPVPRAIDHHVASLKLAYLGMRVDKLTPAQAEYLGRYASE